VHFFSYILTTKTAKSLKLSNPANISKAIRVYVLYIHAHYSAKAIPSGEAEGKKV